MWLKKEVHYLIRTVQVADGQLWHKHIDQLKEMTGRCYKEHIRY